MHLARLMQPSKFLCTRRNEESDFFEGELAERELSFKLGQDNNVYYDVVQAVRTILSDYTSCAVVMPFAIA